MTKPLYAAAIAVVLAATALAGACSENGIPPVARGARSAADSADQFILGMQTIITDGGLKRADVQSDTAYFYHANTRMDMNGVVATFFTSTGLQSGILTSNRAIYDTGTGVMEAFGHVIVVSTEGRRLTTSQLRYDRKTDKVTGDSAFTLTDPDKTTEGVGFDSDPGMTNVSVHHFVKGSATPVTIPK